MRKLHHHDKTGASNLENKRIVIADLLNELNFFLLRNSQLLSKNHMKDYEIQDI